MGALETQKRTFFRRLSQNNLHILIILYIFAPILQKEYSLQKKGRYMKKFLTLTTLLLAITFNAIATDYTVEPTPAVKSNTIPIFRNSASIRGSITQQIYLPSEFIPTGAVAGDIEAVTFYYAAKDANTVDEFSRSIEIWLAETDVNSYSLDKVSTTYNSKFLPKGTKVFDGNLVTSGGITSSNGDQTLTLEFNVSSFSWDGTSNIVLTLLDKSTTNVGTNAYNYLKFYITATDHARFVHQQWTYNAYSFTDDRNEWMSNLHERYGYAYGSGVSDSIGYANKRNFVPKATFSISAPIPAPTSPAASDITTSSATLNWTAATGAEAYEVRYGTTSGSLGEATNVGNVTSYAIDALTDETTYYFQVRTKIGNSYSAWTDEASFTTLAEAAHIHDGITFAKWNNAGAMPTSGNYYLNADVTLTATATLTGDLNLCLNGHNLFTYAYCIVVPDDVTFSVYDNEGSGAIRGAYAGGAANKGLISVAGTLIVREGTIENVYDEEGGYESYAIYNNGTLILSGAPTLSGVTADIYFGANKVLTIQSGKPLTNTTPYRVSKVTTTGAITSGWANMGSAEPSDYFVSANSTTGIALVDGEAKLLKNINLSEGADNTSALNTNDGQVVNVTPARAAFSHAMYNTICLPFSISAAEVETIFGVGTELKELVDATMDNDQLLLAFDDAASGIEAGKPYLIKPANADVTLPVFRGVTVYKDLHPAEFTYADFIGVMSSTLLTADNHQTLFLGANNELFWPNVDSNLKGMRAFFNLKNGATMANRARMVSPRDLPTALDAASTPNGQPVKRLENGQLIILRDGNKYNILGSTFK